MCVAKSQLNAVESLSPERKFDKKENIISSKSDLTRCLWMCSENARSRIFWFKKFCD